MRGPDPGQRPRLPSLDVRDPVRVRFEQRRHQVGVGVCRGWRAQFNQQPGDLDLAGLQGELDGGQRRCTVPAHLSNGDARSTPCSASSRIRDVMS